MWLTVNTAFQFKLDLVFLSHNRKNVLILAATSAFPFLPFNLPSRCCCCRCKRMQISVLFSRTLRNLISRGYCFVIIPRGKVLMRAEKAVTFNITSDWINIGTVYQDGRHYSGTDIFFQKRENERITGKFVCWFDVRNHCDLICYSFRVSWVHLNGGF